MQVVQQPIQWQANTVPLIFPPQSAQPRIVLQQPVAAVRAVSPPVTAQTRYVVIPPTPIQNVSQNLTPSYHEVAVLAPSVSNPKNIQTQSDIQVSPGEGETLPDGFSKFWSPSNQMHYYKNLATGQVNWEPKGSKHFDEMR